MSVSLRSSLLAFGALLVVVPSASAAGFRPADPFVDHAVGTNPLGLATGDLNGDGRADIVAANTGSANVSVLLGQSDGTLAAATQHAVGTTPTSVAIGDLDGDGRADIVAANSSSNTISVLRGAISGFAAQQTYVAGAGARDVALGDVDGDGHLDVVTAETGADTVSVLLGRPDGTLNARTAFPTGDAPYAVALADLNGDGKLDIVTADSGANTVSVLTGDGAGAFGAAAATAVGTTPYDLAVADLNGDARPDVGTANFGAGTTSILLGRNGGGFDPATNQHVGAQQRGLTFADIDGDTKLDLAGTTLAFGPTMEYRAGTGAGTFPGTGSNEAIGFVFTGARRPAAIVTADLNGDGRPEVIVSDVIDSRITVLNNATATAVATPPADSVARTFTVSFSVPRFPAAVDKVAVFAKGPEDSAYTKVHEAAQGVLSGSFSYTATQVGGRYEFRAVGYDASGTALSRPNGSDASTLLRQPDYEVSGTTSFGELTVGATTTRMYQVENGVGTTVKVTGVTVGGTNAGDFTVTEDYCTGRTVGTSSDCSVIAQFKPSASGPREATLTFTTDEGLTRTITMTGTAVAAPPTPTPTPTQTPTATPGPDLTPKPAPTPAALKADVVLKAKAGRKTTTLRSFELKGVTAGATVRVKVGKQSYTFKNANGRVSLKRFTKKPLKAGTKLVITVSKAGATTLTKTVTIRAGKAPLVR